MYGAIEAGGTKMVCAIGNDAFEVVERVSIPTTTPEETMQQVFAFFEGKAIRGLGVGSFGPIDIDETSTTHGYILETPKIAWRGYDFIGELERHFHLPIEWSTDVHVAAYGEYKLGAAKGKHSCLYLTVGTGVGGGLVINEHIYNGRIHPEMGHIMLKMQDGDTFSGICPSHGNCLEGLVSGPAIAKRAGKSAELIDPHDPIWNGVAYYIGQALMTYTLTFAPAAIVLGGGVMKVPDLIEKIKESFIEQMNGYVTYPPIDTYIMPCALGDNAGITGCFLLAADAVTRAYESQ